MLLHLRNLLISSLSTSTIIIHILLMSFLCFRTVGIFRACCRRVSGLQWRNIAHADAGCVLCWHLASGIGNIIDIGDNYGFIFVGAFISFLVSVSLFRKVWWLCVAWQEIFCVAGKCLHRGYR